MHRILSLALALAAVADGPTPPSGVDFRPSLLVQLPVSDLDRSIRFYTKTLGFLVSERRDDLKFAHLGTNVLGVEFGLSEVESPGGSGGVILNLGVADVGEARRSLEAAGVTFDGPTAIIPGKVALAGFRDPDGNRLRLAGPPTR